ncbi:acetyl-CoA acetyltransferase [Ditylenchus destructor]|nr:acetyl-CoA acetyltransferase [Ditylenchus destructor]
MAATRPGIFIVAAKRTAFGTFGGKLKNHTATDLAEVASRAALKSASIAPEHVDHVIFGNVMQSSKDAAYLSRHVGLRIGLPHHVPAVTVNRLCGSGFEAIVQGAQQIIAGDSSVVLAGGTENMTQAPFAVRGARFGIPLGANVNFEDTLWQGLTDSHINTPMGITAETLGEKYKITREEADEFAHKSQSRWRLANNAGYFKAEIEPMKLKSKKGEEVFEVDEHPRETTPESLAKLQPVFKKGGLVNAGNASGICDGAAAVIVANEDSIRKHHLTPLARIVGYHAVGCDPAIMGIGPVEAIRNVLKKTGVSLDDVDLVEVNEAFAPQVLSVQKELKIESDRLNVSGGAIALGHPLGASGARISAHLVHELRRRNVRYGIGSACIGGGQGIAILFERV